MSEAVRGRVDAPWVRTRLRAAPGAACALALLVALTACLAAAFPRALDRYDDAGLHRAVERARPERTSVQLFAPQPDLTLPQEQREEALRPDAVGKRYAKVLAAVERPLVADPDRSAYGVRTLHSMEVPDPWLPRPRGLPAQVVLAAQHGLADHSRLRAGRLPRATGTVTAATRSVEAAVTEATAESLHIKVGSVIHVPGVERAPLAVHVTGIVTPRDPGGAYWATLALLRTPSLVPLPGSSGPDQLKYWLGALLLPSEAAPVMLGTAGEPLRYWQLAPDAGALHAHDLDRLKSAVAALESGPGLRTVRAVTDPATEVETELDDVLTSYSRLRGGIGPLVAVAAFGTGTVAAVVLLMASGLAADRRRAELALLRARGASLPGLAGRLLAETAVVALPAGALGLAAALLAVPGGRVRYAVAAALTVTLLACAALPLRAAAEHRAVRVHGARQDVVAVRPSRRRTVAELTLLVLTAGAVVALRRRGTSDGSDAAGDQLVALAPVLVGMIAALLLVRLYPLPLRRLARPAGRLRGAVGHLSLARAGRTSVSAVLPLLALLTALTTAAFGGSVLAGVDGARDRAALLAVGADARVEAIHPLPSDLTDRVRRTPGVRAVAPVSIAYHANPEDGPVSVPVAGVEPGSYAALAARTGLGTFGKGELSARHSGALPALASPAVARRYGTRPFPVRMEDGTAVTVRITLVRDRTPAVVGDDFLVVDRAGLSARAARPTALLLTGGRLDAGALRKATGETADVQLRAEERARYVDSPLQSGAERVYAAAVAAGAGYAVLALLLSLLRAAPERTALLARLRTMGLTRSQGRRLLVLESLPQAALAAAGGTLTGWATIRLLAPGIDLTAIALASTPSPSGRSELHTDPLSLGVPAAAVLVVAVGVTGAQAWWAGRRGAVAELRAGDAR
ncbi:FtsX-like permease family protein [Streptomyces sp. S.PNR 29]|uniref:FtsX-like permease family protein n=1 Tax=Streptomyces sp. S.PNR 29 TaxID=2973805 RepID=UPI0025AF90F4|nr:FtsX-like permease family protein [Streptomyces sp. S.PNR 29]MDN0196899.1 ABC transporter permease [Streptomyces sp. S.PNR 29]